MLAKLNLFLQKWMPLLTPLSLIIGVIFESFGQQLLFLVAWLFALMTFISSLSMKFQDVKVFVRYPKTILIVILFLHLLMPLWAFFLSTVIFDDTLLMIGFVLSVAVPTGVTSIIWVTISRGNVPLSLAIVLIDTLLAPIIMPLLIEVVAGQTIHINTKSLIFDLIWMVVLPSVVGIIINEKTNGAIHRKLNPYLSPLSKICLFAVVMINSSAIAPFIKDITLELFLVIVVVFIISVSGYVFAYLLSKILWSDEVEMKTAFLFTAGMRNIALGVVIATTYFPSKVAMPVVFGMLFQQVLASVMYRINERMKKVAT